LEAVVDPPGGAERDEGEREAAVAPGSAITAGS